MFERMSAAGEHLAKAAAADRRSALAASLDGQVPGGVTVTQEGEAVVLTGRNLVRRAVADSGLRWSAWEAAR